MIRESSLTGKPYNYVRIAVTESNAGSVTATGGYWNCGELEIYGQ